MSNTIGNRTAGLLDYWTAGVLDYWNAMAVLRRDCGTARLLDCKRGPATSAPDSRYFKKTNKKMTNQKINPGSLSFNDSYKKTIVFVYDNIIFNPKNQ